MIANGYFLRVVAERWGISGVDLALVNSVADRLNEYERMEASLRDSLGDENYFIQAARDQRYAEREAELADHLNRRSLGR